MSEKYEEIRVLFDQYKRDSLKMQTRKIHAKIERPVHYHIKDSTKILKSKKFLSHILTKSELTKYLLEKSLSHFKTSAKKVVVLYHNLICAIYPLHETVSLPMMYEGVHNLEEGDQQVLLHAVDIANN